MASSTAKLIYGMKSKAFRPSDFSSVKDAFARFAEGEFGTDPEQAILVTSGGNAIDPGTAPQAGASYKVSIKLGDKG